MIESVSKRAFSGSSGTYNVHALELAAARERKLKTLSITVKFLDDTEHVFHIEKRAKGTTLLEQVYHHLELVEKDYFGLQYSDSGSLPGTRGSVWMRWLDPSKSIKKQLGTCQYPLYFRVKFYVSDPSKLQEEYTRYQFYLQLRRDILEGKLLLAISTAILLASYTVQSELGDYQPEEHGPNYLSNIQLIPNQTEDIEAKISELHKLHNGILMLKLGLLMGDAAMIQVNVACILLNFIYTVIFQYYSKDKTNEVFKPTSIGVGVVAVCLGYASIEDEANLEFRFGLIVTVLLLVVIGSPLLDVNTIIEAQDASSIPFPLTFMGTLVSTLWLLYGIILNNIFMVVQNVVGLLLCVVQLFLIFKYPGSSEQAKKKKKVSKKD